MEWSPNVEKRRGKEILGEGNSTDIVKISKYVM
jgi:hypothetical protein